MTAHRFIDRDTGEYINEKRLHDEVAAILRDFERATLQEQTPSETGGGTSDIPPPPRLKGGHNRGGIIPTTPCTCKGPHHG